MINSIIEIDIKQLNDQYLIDILNKAGFEVIRNRSSVELIDKKSSESYKYSDLYFRSLVEAVKTVGIYLYRQYKFVAWGEMLLINIKGIWWLQKLQLY